MKKIVFCLSVIFLFMTLVNAECDYDRFQTQSQIAGNITTETHYDENSKKHSVTFYNIYDGIYISYNHESYYADANNEITITDIVEGEKANFVVSSPLDECKSYMRTITLVFGYYNRFYFDSRCEQYKNVLNICSEKFLDYKPSETMFKSIIDNYGSSFKIENKKTEEEERTVLESIKEIFFTWGVPVIIVIVVSAITSSLFKIRLRKLKHGI